jgi:hypothetical protein
LGSYIFLETFKKKTYASLGRLFFLVNTKVDKNMSQNLKIYNFYLKTHMLYPRIVDLNLSMDINSKAPG